MNIREKYRELLGPTADSYDIDDLHRMALATISALREEREELRRGAPVHHRYFDCADKQDGDTCDPQGSPERERLVTCARCRNDLGLPPLEGGK